MARTPVRTGGGPPRTRITGAAIAADALRWKGETYVYGGTDEHPGDWDCSSYVSYVLGHDLRMSLPGGRWGDPGFPPGSHGPVVLDYARWDGATTVPIPARGDLCVWQGLGPNGHIGIALGRTQMISALNTAQGTVVTPIQGFGPPGAPLIYRRVAGAVGKVPRPVRRVTGQENISAVALPLLLVAGALIAGFVLVTVVIPLAAGVVPVVFSYVVKKAVTR